MEKRLYRSRSDRMICGVCGGLAEYFNLDPTIIRIIAVLLVFANGLGILAYIILAIVVPQRDSKTTEPKDTIKENVEEITARAKELGQEIRSTFAGKEDSTVAGKKTRQRPHVIVGIIVIALGVLLLLGNLNLFWWLRWSYFWPLILVAVGLLIIFSARRK